MKRLIGILVLALTGALFCFALVGCGSGSGDSETTTDDSQATEAVEPEGPAEPVEVALSDSTDIVVEGDYELTRPVYKKEKNLEYGEFALSDYISDASLEEGWWYYYTEYEGDTVDYLEWPQLDGCYPVKVDVLFTNLKDEPVDLADRISGAITFDSGGDGEDLIDCTFFVRNLGQKDSDGYPVVNTKVFNPVNPGETVEFGFFANIPKDELDSDKPLELCFSIDDGALYLINLRAELEDNAKNPEFSGE